MIEVVGVSFKNKGKIYYFLPNKMKLEKGIKVLVSTDKGLQIATVEVENMDLPPEKIKTPLSEVKSICTPKDLQTNEKNIELSKKALQKCRELVKEYDLNMAILSASYSFDRSQLLFTFLSTNRVDFRKLAKELASIFKTRIELRQIGVRDKAKEVGGYGSCGRTLCCSRFLCDFDSVSINMAKNQGIALNPNKINGSCGRLLCCLKYEDDCYKEYNKNMPKIGKRVATEYGDGKVISVDTLKQKYRVDVKDHGIVEIDVNEND